jgi:hypothetical protein
MTVQKCDAVLFRNVTLCLFRNVTLYCEVVEGNPGKLNSVLWYKDSTLLKQLPQCNTDQETFPSFSAPFSMVINFRVMTDH